MDQEIKLDDSNELEPSIRSVVTSLMFTSGDDENPLSENEDFVVNILKNELVLFINDVIEVYDNKIPNVKLQHMLQLLNSQKGVLSRFIKYLKNRVEMSAFMRAKSFSKNGTENICGQEVENEDETTDEKIEEGVDPMDEIGEVGGEEGEYLKNKRRTYGTITSEENLLQEAQKSFFDAGLDFNTFENDVDENHNQQLIVLQTILEDMNADEYSRFALARRVSFQNQSAVPVVYSDTFSKSNARKRKRSPPTNNRQLLLQWLGNPPVHDESAQVFLAFLAKDIISEIVGNALLERRKMNPAEGGPLSYSYYEEPLRRNRKFRKYGRILI